MIKRPVEFILQCYIIFKMPQIEYIVKNTPVTVILKRTQYFYHLQTIAKKCDLQRSLHELARCCLTACAIWNGPTILKGSNCNNIWLFGCFSRASNHIQRTWRQQRENKEVELESLRLQGDISCLPEVLIYFRFILTTLKHIKLFTIKTPLKFK